MATSFSPIPEQHAAWPAERRPAPTLRNVPTVSEVAGGDRKVEASAAPSLASSHTVRSLPEAIAAVCSDILAHGIEYISSEYSMNSGRSIREIFNCTVALTNPGARVASGFGLSPGLAAARALYLLSGSNALAGIRYYTQGVARFSGDGMTLPGSAYGYRIFGGARGHANLFEEAARVIASRANSKRASIPIFWPHDTEAAVDTPDLPCAFGVHFSLRDAGLLSSVTMRANDAFKILPYNLFEFSLLGECMAARVGARHLGHVHSSVSMHLRDTGIDQARLLPAGHVPAQATPRIRRFDDGVRSAVAAAEQAVRQAGGAAKIDDVLRLLPAEHEDGPWRDLLLAAALLGAEAGGVGTVRCEDARRVIGPEAEAFPVASAEIARQLSL